MVGEGRATLGAKAESNALGQEVRREESYLDAEDKISPVVEMTCACHSDQREESCFMPVGDNYLE